MCRPGPYPYIGVGQDSFIDRLESVSIDTLSSQSRIIRPRTALLRVFRRTIGPSIWAAKNRYYSSFLVSKLATSLTHRRAAAAGIREIASLIINKLARSPKSIRLTLWYRVMFPRPSTLSDLRQIKLFSFSDFAPINVTDNKAAGSFLTMAAIHFRGAALFSRKARFRNPILTRSLARRVQRCAPKKKSHSATLRSAPVSPMHVNGTVFLLGSVAANQMRRRISVVFAVWTFVAAPLAA